MRAQGYEMQYDGDRIAVVYVLGPLFFGTSNTFNSAVENLNGAQDVILSLRAVPLLDTTGISVIEEFIERVEAKDGQIYLCALNDPVRSYLTRAGVIKHVGEDHVFWSADQAIIALDRYRAGQFPASDQDTMQPAPV
jgi:sulfate permease, SulP family